MYKYIVLGSIFALSLVLGPAIAQSGSATHLGMPRNPTHYKCEFWSDFGQALCSGTCGKKGGTWIAITLQSVDEDGNVVPGEGECQGVD